MTHRTSYNGRGRILGLHTQSSRQGTLRYDFTVLRIVQTAVAAVSSMVLRRNSEFVGVGDAHLSASSPPSDNRDGADAHADW